MQQDSYQIKIAKAIIYLKQNNVKPSQNKVRAITKGSLSTIGPIFRKMAKQFLDFSDLDNLAKHYKLKLPKPNLVFKENLTLKEKLDYLESHNLNLERELISKEQKLDNLTAKHTQLENLYKELKNEREFVLAKVTKSKDRQIELLNEELAATHKEHNLQYREFSFQHEDRLMELKIKNSNLAAKVDDLNQRLKISQENAIPQQKIIKNLQTENAKLVNRLIKYEPIEVDNG